MLAGSVLAGNQKNCSRKNEHYVDTFIQRDIQDLVRVRHPQHFRRLMELFGQSNGWGKRSGRISDSCAETRTNVSRYMSLLKDTNVLYELKGYTVKGERAYKQAKHFWFDSGVASFLSGIHSSRHQER